MLGDLDAAYIVGPRARYKKEKSAATFRFQFVLFFLCSLCCSAAELHVLSRVRTCRLHGTTVAMQVSLTFVAAADGA